MSRIALGDDHGNFTDSETGATFTGRPAAEQPAHLSTEDRARLAAGDMFVVGALYEFDMPDEPASE